MGTSDEQELQKVDVRRLKTDEAELAVFEFQGELRDLMISNFHQGFLTTGSYMEDAKAVSPQGAQSIAVAGAAGGATALSGAFSSSLFIATADPSTLMQIGNGYGAAVMGAKGITSHAPFIPVASSLPVVAPILAIHALSSAMMMQQFRQVDQKLKSIKSSLDRVLARIEATHAGQLLSSSNIVDELYHQYELEGVFSHDMLTRLALAERDVSALATRFRHLVEGQVVTDVDEPEDVQRANYDAHSAMLASFANLRIAYLRVCVDMQENPKSVNVALKRLKAQLQGSTTFWEQLLHRSQVIKEKISELETQLQDRNWAERNLPKVTGGKSSSQEKELETLKDAYTATMESELGIMKNFHSLIQAAENTLTALDNLKTPTDAAPTLVYWKDESGEHSFVTEQLQLA